MKCLFTEPLKNWFGYTRRERRASLLLLLIIIAVAGVRYLFPGRESDIKVIPLNFSLTGTDTTQPGNVYSHSPVNGKPVTTVNKLKKNILDINTCDSASLVALPGIGPVLSARIIKYRKLLGGFASVNQLREVYGLSTETFDLISGMVKADSPAVKKININSAEYRQLLRMPYLDKTEVAAILKYRELKGRIGGMNEMIDNKLVRIEVAEKVKPYLEFN
ncbi:MAG: helix-hairpin-helix domain-containing protein [Bacteroidales bacterium]|jgi:DNA uptake protein ComE-like DNA-binding protein|nr:helix-hairpin-helix domain-containing protein [Bacteroidales bacterium]